MLEIFDGALDEREIFARWDAAAAEQNCGALVLFVGLVRSGEEAQALSFDIYEPLLKSWFENWENKAQSRGASLLMAHSKGDVPAGKSSFIAGAISRHRRAALELLDEFVEDFKASAPIWKYDVKGGARIYARARSKAIKGTGILAREF